MSKRPAVPLLTDDVEKLIGACNQGRTRGQPTAGLRACLSTTGGCTPSAADSAPNPSAHAAND